MNAQPYIIISTENKRDLLVVSQEPLTVRYFESVGGATGFKVNYVGGELITIEHLAETLIRRGFVERQLDEQEIQRVLVNAIFRTYKFGEKLYEAILQMGSEG